MTGRRTLRTAMLVLLVLVLAITFGAMDIDSEAELQDPPEETDSMIYAPIVIKPARTIYESANLDGHSLYAECNPDDGTSCGCSELDVGLVSFAGHGEVTSNVRRRHTYVNALGYMKFTEVFPSGESLSLDTYRYKGEFSLPIVPLDDVSQAQNPQAIHMMIQFWDGRSELHESNNHTLEAVIYWDLNPWTQDYGKIKVYAKPAILVDSGITLTPDTNWHTFELVANLETQHYEFIVIDGMTADLSSVELAQVYQPEWGTDLSLSITTESLAAWPKADCEYMFWWTTRFRNLHFSFD
jgi:hypothetical protein